MYMGITIIGLSLLICMELVSSSKANNCTSFQAFGKRIGDAINADLMQKFSCKSVTCNKIRCSGIPLYTTSSLKQNVTFSADIDYCSPKPRIQLKVYASSFNVTRNTTLLNNKNVSLLLSSKKKIYVLISAKFLKTNKVLNVTIAVKFSIPLIDGAKIEIIKHFGGSISSSYCRRTLTTMTIPKVTSTTNSSATITSLRTSSMTSTATTVSKTTARASTTSKPTTKTVTTSKPTIKTVTTSKPTNTQKTSKLTTSILKATTIAKKVAPIHSKTNKTILLILAIIILVVVIAMVIYCRRKKRLSNLPAYYNDIVINDPLKLEIEENDIENANDADDINDDDELPLFS